MRVQGVRNKRFHRLEIVLAERSVAEDVVLARGCDTRVASAFEIRTFLYCLLEVL
jgi:hypothetical protein